MVIKKFSIILVLFLCMVFSIFSVEAKETTTKSVIKDNESGEVIEKKMNFFEDLHYRIIYKDTKDFFDYVLLGIAIIALLIVMVFQNTHYVIVRTPLEENTFINSDSNYTIEEVEEEKEEDEIEPENPEILSSSLLEEETPKVPKKKKSKKKRA